MGGTSNDQSRSVAVDALGNVYTTGSFSGTVDFDPNAGIYNLTSTGGTQDIFVSKLDVSGNLVWAKAISGNNNEVGFDIAVDASGNLYITGNFAGTVDFDPNAGVSNLTSSGFNDIFVSKLNANGNLVWAKTMGNVNNDSGNSITIDASGNVYTVGFFSGTVDFDPNAGVSNLISAGAIDIFVSKLDANGNLVWAKAMGGTSSDVGNGISIDSNGNVYTTGQFSGTADFDPSAGVSNLTSAAGSGDVFLSKLDAFGNFVWAKAMGGTSGDIAYGITVDSSGNVYSTGYFQGTADFDPNVGINNLTSLGSTDVFVSKLDASGNLVWAKAMGNTGTEVSFGIVVDGFGNVYTTGQFSETVDFDPNAGVSNLISAGINDVFVSKLDATGNLVWAKAMGGTTGDTGIGLALDASGNIFTTGIFTGTADFDPNAGVFNLTSVGGQDIFVHKMSTLGAALSFDGADDYVTCGNVMPATYTKEAWFYTSNLSFQNNIISGGSDGQHALFASPNYGQRISAGHNGTWDSVQDPTQIVANTWYHVALTYDAATTTMKLYTNGILVSTNTEVNPFNGGNALRIGAFDDASNLFGGKIDEVRIWNRVLSQAEIQNNMNCELAAGQTGLVVYYQFNQGLDSDNNSSISSLIDTSGNDNTGTLNNFALNGTTSNWVAPGGVTTGNACPTYLNVNDAEFSSKLSVYPNPSSTVFFINSDTSGTIVIYDLIGKIIKSENIDSGITKLDLSNYPSGIYLMKVTNDKNETKTIKLMKQ